MTKGTTDLDPLANVFNIKMPREPTPLPTTRHRIAGELLAVVDRGQPDTDAWPTIERLEPQGHQWQLF